MSSKHPRKLLYRLIFACLIIIISFGILVLGGNIRLDCDARNSLVPSAPVYSNSKLVSQDIIQDSKNVGIFQYNYESQATPSKIADFYSQIATCNFNEDANQNHCRGDASPFGKYDVFISYKVATSSSYHLDLRWDKCGTDWEVSIE